MMDDGDSNSASKIASLMCQRIIIVFFFNYIFYSNYLSLQLFFFFLLLFNYLPAFLLNLFYIPLDYLILIECVLAENITFSHSS
jgi:hypothetical protein